MNLGSGGNNIIAYIEIKNNLLGSVDDVLEGETIVARVIVWWLLDVNRKKKNAYVVEKKIK